MLKYLHIENIAVIEKTDIELKNGFNVLTGETGAGKSIIIDSINAILGQRTSKDIIRSGCEKALVTAVFSDVGDVARNSLDENGIFADDNGEYIITRLISNDSRTSIKINGQPISATVMRSIGSLFVNIHGQHDNQSLLDDSTHCSFIDLVAENQNLLDDYYLIFKKLNSVRRELNSVVTDEDEKQRRKDLLEYQIRELEAAEISVGEEKQLKESLKEIQNSEKILKSLKTASQLLCGTENSEGATAMLSTAADSIRKSGCSKLTDCIEKLELICYEASAVGDTVNSYLDNTSFDESQINVMSSRLELIKTLAIKYGCSGDELVKKLTDAKAELDTIQNSDELKQKLEKEFEDCQEELIIAGKALSKSREIAAKKFCKDVTDILTYLDMPNVTFTIEHTTGRYTKYGCDEIRFLISSNKGEEPKPLSKIASGGELSRVMLAIKSVLTHKDSVGTLIFDEIDTGISGRAAMKIAEQLRKLSAYKQVICVTHLAQIGAAANSHYLIEKNVQDSRTVTNVIELDNDGRLNELSRIIGGRVSDANIATAKELIDIFG